MRTIKQKQEHKEGGKKIFYWFAESAFSLGHFGQTRERGTFGAELIECSGTLELNTWFVRPTPTSKTGSALSLCYWQGCPVLTLCLFHFICCSARFLVQYEFADNFVVLAKRRLGQIQSAFCDKVQSCLCTCTALSPPTLFEYQFCKGFGTGTSSYKNP